MKDEQPFCPEVEAFPILIVHQGNSPYLETCLRQARKSNPHARIVWLHGPSDQPFDFVECHSYEEPELYRDVPFFHSIYQHHCFSSPLEGERFCMQRWLIVRNFMRRESLRRCLAIDSDVLLFCDVAEEACRFQKYAMTFARWNRTQNLIHCNFVQDLSALESFGDYLLAIYENPHLLERVKQSSRQKREHCRVSDMSLFYDWSIHSDFPFCFFEDFYTEGIFFDSCLDFTHDFQSTCYLPGILRPFKQIVWKNELPYATLKNGRTAPMKAIHYHGSLKLLIPWHYEHISPHLTLFRQLLWQKVQKLPYRLRLLWRNYVRPLFSTGK